jgi:hypothetical protein
VPLRPLARILTYVLDDHDQEGELDSKGLLLLGWAGDVVCGNIGAHDFEDGGLNVGIGQSLDMTVANLLLPDLEWLGAIRVTRVRFRGKIVGRGWQKETYPME